MKWIPISEKPKKDGWYLGWCPRASVDNWDPVRWFEGRWLDDTCLTHWAEITGPEDADKPEQYLEVLSETKELLERVVNSGLLSVCDCRRFNSVIQKIETISTARTAGGL